MLRKLMPVICLGVILGVIAAPASAQTYSELISFDGNTAAGPLAPLTQGVDGDLYGMTAYGGTGDCRGNEIGCGVIFKITHDGKFDILYNFQASDPGLPAYNLSLANNGSLYGIATGGDGNIFSVTPEGAFSVVYEFKGANDAGYYPYGGLTLGADGNFYGTTYYGGMPSNSCPNGCGTIYEMTPSGGFTTLYSFCPQNYCPDGEYPAGPLAQGFDGNFYGTTTYGGLYKDGTIFKITPKGRFTLLYTFENFSSAPGLILGNDGNFYGAEYDGDRLYRITPQGVLTELPPFAGAGTDLPTVGSDGNLYWSEQGGAEHGLGGLFEMAPTGNPSTLYSFSGYPNDGSYPDVSLVQATNGTFYGTTFTGGSSPCNYGSYPGCGTVFSLDMGLDPFVTFVRRAARVGRQVKILGQGFEGTTDVSFNGTSATFTVKSQTLLEATVPSGATSGPVTVTTPSGNLTSNVAFIVIP